MSATEAFDKTEVNEKIQMANYMEEAKESGLEYDKKKYEAILRSIPYTIYEKAKAAGKITAEIDKAFIERYNDEIKYDSVSLTSSIEDIKENNRKQERAKGL